MALIDTDYLHQLQALLPHGPAWPRDDTAALTRLLAALATELTRVDGRAMLLVEEADPRTTAVLLSDWDRVSGLPDPCVSITGQIQGAVQRHAALVARLTMLGGQSGAYFIALSASMGYSITIKEFQPFCCGVSCAGDPLTNGNWRWAWQVNAPLNTVTAFRAGRSVSGDALNAWGNKPLECVLNRFKPIHTTVIFAYS